MWGEVSKHRAWSSPIYMTHLRELLRRRAGERRRAVDGVECEGQSRHISHVRLHPRPHELEGLVALVG